MEPEKPTAEMAEKAGGFLLAEGSPMPLRRLVRLVGCSHDELAAALKELSARLAKTGIALITTETEAALVVSPEAASAVREASKKDLERDIGDAGLEVLAILLYRGSSTRTQIDYIRGVNTSTTLRTLLARGLVLRVENPKDAREYLYRPTAELLAHLGVTDIAHLPERDRIASELAAFETRESPFKAEDHGNPDDTASDATSA